MSGREQPKSRNYTPVVIGLSVIINLTVALLFVLPGYRGLEHVDLSFLPMMNAIFNSFTTVFLLAAFWAIKQQDIKTHRNFVLAAFSSTTMFLLTYVTYHFLTESTKYGGAGILRYIYLFLLLTHIVLAIVIVPLALFSLFSGMNRQVDKHRTIVRWTLPLWLYVSVTGVVVYLMIRPYY